MRSVISPRFRDLELTSHCCGFTTSALGSRTQKSKKTMSSSSAPASTQPQLLPDYFPGVTKACSQVGETFLACYTKEAVKKNENDTTSGVEAVKLCAKELAAYKACMDQHVKKIETKKFRVGASFTPCHSPFLPAALVHCLTAHSLTATLTHCLTVFLTQLGTRRVQKQGLGQRPAAQDDSLIVMMFLK